MNNSRFTTVYNFSQIEKFRQMDVFCLNETSQQRKLKFVSILYLSLGSVFSTIILVGNLLFIVFFVCNARSKRSPICILSFFLAICNTLRLLEFYLAFLIKTNVLGLENHKDILYTNSQPNDKICSWLHFLPSISGHIGVYIVLLLQFHRHLALKKTSYSFNLLLHNYALTYFICIGLVFTFLIVDEFYLFEAYFTTIIYCPRTMVFICVFNKKFQLLNGFAFDSLLYHHVHTFFYNIMPISLIVFINTLVLKGLRRRAIDASLESTKVSSRKVSVSGACSATSLRRNSSTNLKDPSQQQPLQLPATMATSHNKRARLSLSVNLSSSQQLSHLQGIDIAVKRSKRESHPLNLNEIFLQNVDVSYMSVWLSFVQIFNALPTNILSYLAEWTSYTIDQVKRLSYEQNGATNYDTLYNIPTKLLGFHWTLPQINIYYAFILYGCIDILNFSIFLFYQFYSCSLLRRDFHQFLFSFRIFRPFLKPANYGRNRLNSSSGRQNFTSSSSSTSARRASKI